MKNILKILLSAFAAFVFVWACADEDSDPKVGYASTSNLKITSSLLNDGAIGDIVVQTETANVDTIKTAFTPVEYSINLVPEYRVEVCLAGTNFNPAKNVGPSSTKSPIKFTLADLNSALLGLGAASGVPVSVQIRIKSNPKRADYNSDNISPYYEYVYSDPVTFTVTPSQAVKSYIYAIGQFQGWTQSSPEPLVSATSNGVYIGYINFPAGNDQGWLLVPDSPVSWANKWGGNESRFNLIGGGTASLVVDGGDNLPEPGTGYWKITADLNALSVSTEAYSWGIVGDAVGSWDTDQDMVWNSANERWEKQLSLFAGELKFRLNKNWDVNLGGDGLSGIGSQNGPNIAINSAGTYFITLNSDTFAYTITKL